MHQSVQTTVKDLISAGQIQIDDGAQAETQFEILAATAEWLKEAVIGLNLCPFAKGPWQKKQIRFRLTNAGQESALLEVLREELLLLASRPIAEVETSLLIHPQILQDFYAYNEFLARADDLLIDLELDGVLQIASFHPQYQFADSQAEDIENYTNRSPFPCLHLLREESLDRAVQAFPDAADIYEKNIETMQKLGFAGWQALATWQK